MKHTIRKWKLPFLLPYPRPHRIFYTFLDQASKKPSFILVIQLIFYRKRYVAYCCLVDQAIDSLKKD